MLIASVAYSPEPSLGPLQIGGYDGRYSATTPAGQVYLISPWVYRAVKQPGAYLCLLIETRAFGRYLYECRP